MQTKGIVYLVGAGPGDTGLITVRGAELLGRADVVVHDALIARELLRYAPRAAELVDVGKRSGDHPVPQAEINELLVARARAGKTVVRLKGGDPCVFGRGGEEGMHLAAAGIAFEIIPGVSSVTAVPVCAGIPLTHRGGASSFIAVTGHEDPAKGESAVDWARVASMPGTKVILMALDRADEIARELVANGLALSTPVAVIAAGATPRQETRVGTLGDLAHQGLARGVGSPALLVIGEVVRLRETLNWFERRPLFGTRIVVTRTRDQASKLVASLAERGADVLEIPTIRLAAPTQLTPLVEAIAGIGEYDWLVFTSPNGVTCFFDYFFKAFSDVRDLGHVRIAAVGPATAARVAELHLKVDVMPETYLARSVADAIRAYESVENLRLLLVRAEMANPDLPRRLEELGGIVDDIACYRTVPEPEDRHEAAARLQAAGADWITFTSASTVENFHARFDLPGLKRRFPSLRFASIGPETTKALEALSLKPEVQAKPHTVEALAAALEASHRKSGARG